MEKTNLEIAKEIIKEHIEDARYGIFNCRNIVGDPMKNIYNKNGLIIDICYCWEYYEVFGLAESEFSELAQFYQELIS